jgi:hypothetical protein
MNEIEEAFVKTFISRDRRGRWLSCLPDEKKRGKVLHKLAHTLTEYLDPRFVYEKDNLPPDIAAPVEKLLQEWKRANPKQLCYIICNGDRDGEQMSLPDAEADYELTFGAIIILIPDKLAYYHTERSNLNKQPYYVLFHP